MKKLLTTAALFIACLSQAQEKKDTTIAMSVKISSTDYTSEITFC